MGDNEHGYIGAVPKQLQYTNQGVLGVNELYNLKNKTPQETKGDFITLDFVAVAGAGGGGGGSFLHGSGVSRGGGGGAGEYLAVDNANTYFKLGTTYAITIGAGGNGATGTSSNNGSGPQGSAGSNTTMANETGTLLTLLGGGGGGGTNTFAHGLAGGTGGSGGGTGGSGGAVAAGAASTANMGVGNAGGTGNTTGSAGFPGHGGGASAAGLPGNTSNTRPTGYFHLETLVGLGQPPARNGFYVDWVLAENSTRGSTLARGGGDSSNSNSAPANTGIGGMGIYSNGTAMNGGSGLVAFRYPKELTITAASATVATATVGDYKITEVTASSGGTVRWD